MYSRINLITISSTKNNNKVTSNSATGVCATTQYEQEIFLIVLVDLKSTGLVIKIPSLNMYSYIHTYKNHLGGRLAQRPTYNEVVKAVWRDGAEMEKRKWSLTCR